MLGSNPPRDNLVRTHQDDGPRAPKRFFGAHRHSNGIIG